MFEGAKGGGNPALFYWTGRGANLLSTRQPIIGPFVPSQFNTETSQMSGIIYLVGLVVVVLAVLSFFGLR